ncbi:MAG: hypothetical protein ACOC0A_03120, partial [Planctomycetota bacterium]
QQLTHQLDDDAVIFAQRPLHFHLGVRADFRVYDLRTFNKAYGKRAFQKNGPDRPRRQPRRTEMFKKFYETTDTKELKENLAGLIGEYMNSGRQVAFVISPNQTSHYNGMLDDGCELKEIEELSADWKRWQRQRGRPRGIYVVDCKSESRNNGDEQ